jgi:hypothetical protein
MSDPFLRDDAIRVVPLHSQAELAALVGDAPAAAPTQLTYRGGPLLAAAEVFTVFWGEAWQSNVSLVNGVNTFFSDILTSELIDQLGEYSVPAYAIGHGSLAGTLTVASPAPAAATSDGAIQGFLQDQIASSAVPQPSANVLYFVYLPAGVTVSQGGARSCQAFCGYHSDIGGTVFYAVMPYPGCAGCIGNMEALDALTSTSSHELCEAITDPIPGSGWYDDVHGEIGDICAWRTKTVAGHVVQLEWSNAAGACV